MPESERMCSACYCVKPLDQFNKASADPDGRQRRCRECGNAASRAYRSANAERVAEYNRQWRADNPGVAKACTDSWRERNAERYAETKRQWAIANADHLLERARADRAANPDRYRVALARWKADNPERVREYQRRRRAAGYGGLLGTVDGEALWEACGGRCGICSELIDRSLSWPDPGSPSIDHILPLSKGGAHDQANTQWACLACNLRKGDALPRAALMAAQ